MASKRYYYNCCVLGCSNTTITNHNFSFFRLPVNEERRTEWLKLIQREDLNNKPSIHCRVCESHFSADCILTSPNRKVLKKTAAPKLLLPEQPKDDNKTEEMPELQISTNFSQDDSRKRKHKNKAFECEKRLKLMADTETESSMFFNLCDKYLNKHFASIVKEHAKLQLQSSTNRYNLNDKIFCLKLFYANPRGYNLLKDTLFLPSKKILKIMYTSVLAKVVNHFMAVLKTKVEQMTNISRHCSLVMGATSLKGNLSYQSYDDKIYGFQEIDGIQSPARAKYALVMMVQGIFDNYNLPVGYALLENCEDHYVSEWIDKIIQQLFAIGLNVRALISNIDSVCFKSATYRSVSIKRPYFFIGDRKIYYVFDSSNLIKLVRNNLMVYNYHFDKNVAKWNYIQQFYEQDKTKQVRIAKKLTDSHMKPSNIEKRNVEYATQVLSGTVAAGVSTYRDFRAIDQDAEGTIKLITMMNDLFDFLNSSSRYNSTINKNAFCGKEYQIVFINRMLDFFASLKVVNPRNDQDVTSHVKFIEGYQITLKSILLLFEDLKIEGHTHILTRRLNQDCLENFFGRIRKKNGNLQKPTSWQIISGFRKIFFINVLKTHKNDCTNDLANILLESKEHNISPEQNQKGIMTIESNRIESKGSVNEIPIILTTDYSSLDLPEKNALIYTCGYLLKKCCEHHKDCRLLKSYIKCGANAQNFSEDTRYTRYKNYCNDGGKHLQFIPQDIFVQFVESLEAQFCKFLKINYLNCKILEGLLKVVQNVSFPMPCKCFPVDYCKHLYLRMRIYFTVNSNNLASRQCRNSEKHFTVTNRYV